MTCTAVLLGGLLFQGPAALPAGEFTVELEQVSVFEAGEMGEELRSGMVIVCAQEADPKVDRYPAFRSRAPLFGAASLGRRPGDPESPIPYLFAIDESAGAGTGYDRLHLDLDRDLDLADDEPLQALADPPAGAHRGWFDQEACFGPLELECELGAGLSRTVEVMARVTIVELEEGIHPCLSFFETHLRRGEVEITGVRYGVVLGNDRQVGAGLDQPRAALYLIPPEDDAYDQSWWGGDRLNAVHRLSDELFEFSASPIGDRLSVRPYAGELGTLVVGTGGRDLEDLEVRGSIRSEQVGLAVGEQGEGGWHRMSPSCRLPVGDYLPVYLDVRFGPLMITLSQNYHSEGTSEGRGDRADVYGIRIRADETFALDFTGEPDVMFLAPRTGRRLAPGDTLEVEAVLIDPALDVMVRGLTDSRQSREVTYEDADGNSRSYPRSLPLDPKVIITRENGERVAEGVMPFG